MMAVDIGGLDDFVSGEARQVGLRAASWCGAD